ncbi:MAG: PDZ domain-containing protein [Planctomycetes bacterium]|nr:PDZ domain-containing protein [Planctomycetota bacterium]
MKRRFLGLLAVLSLCGAQATASAAALALLPPGADKPYVGVRLAPAGSGLEVLTVLESTPAQRAGLESGDVITALDAAPIASIESLNEALSRRAPGDRIELSILRGDREVSVIVELGAKPAATELKPGFLSELPEPEVFLAEPPQEAPRGGGYLGIFVEPTDGGAKIAGVRPGSPAEQGRLKEGDTILAIDGKKVESADQLKEILAARAAGDEIQVTILRDGGEKQRIVKLARFEDLDWSEAALAAPAPEPAAPEAGAPASGEGMLARPLVRRAVKTPKVRLAVPAEPAVAEKQAEDAKRGWLGIYFGEDEKGVTVDGTVPDGPAEKAGVQAGDVILYLDETKIDSSADLLKVLEGTRKGKTVAMMVLREGKPLEFDVKLGKQPAEASFAAEDFVEVAPAPRARIAKAVQQKKPAKAKKAGSSFTLAPERSIRLVPGAGGGFMLKVDGQEEGLEIPAHGGDGDPVRDRPAAQGQEGAGQGPGRALLRVLRRAVLHRPRPHRERLLLLRRERSARRREERPGTASRQHDPGADGGRRGGAAAGVHARRGQRRRQRARAMPRG